MRGALPLPKALSRLAAATSAREGLSYSAPTQQRRRLGSPRPVRLCARHGDAVILAPVAIAHGGNKVVCCSVHMRVQLRRDSRPPSSK
jgi:hypothetical protein